MKERFCTEWGKPALRKAPPCRGLGCSGIRENERNIANKLSRGSFTAEFFVQLHGGCRTIYLNRHD